jgi:hypothetical protein
MSANRNGDNSILAITDKIRLLACAVIETMRVATDGTSFGKNLTTVSTHVSRNAAFPVAPHYASAASVFVSSFKRRKANLTIVVQL